MSSPYSENQLCQKPVMCKKCFAYRPLLDSSSHINFHTVLSNPAAIPLLLNFPLDIDYVMLLFVSGLALFFRQNPNFFVYSAFFLFATAFRFDVSILFSTGSFMRGVWRLFKITIGDIIQQLY